MILARGRLWIFVVFAGMCLSASAAETFIFHLRNGDRITGKLVSETDKQVKITTPWDQELTLPLDTIEKREKPEPPKPAQAAQPVTPAPPVPSALPPPQPPPAKTPKMWFFDIQAGVDLALSQSDRELYSGRVKINYANPRNKLRNEFDYKAVYGTIDDRLSANRMDAYDKTDFDVGARLFIYNLAGVGYDEVRLIDLQYELGPGLGYHLIKATNFVMNTELGGSYQEQIYSNGTERDDFRLRVAENIVWRPLEKLTIEERAEFMPRMEDPTDFRLRFEGTLRYWLFQNISLNLTILDLYDTDPPRGVSNNDLQIRSSIGVKF